MMMMYPDMTQRKNRKEDIRRSRWLEVAGTSTELRLQATNSASCPVANHSARHPTVNGSYRVYACDGLLSDEQVNVLPNHDIC